MVSVFTSGYVHTETLFHFFINHENDSSASISTVISTLNIP